MSLLVCAQPQNTIQRRSAVHSKEYMLCTELISIVLLVVGHTFNYAVVQTKFSAKLSFMTGGADQNCVVEKLAERVRNALDVNSNKIYILADNNFLGANS